MRPKNVLLQTKAKHFQCLCKYCTNIDLKIKTINSAVIQNKLQCTLPDRYFAANLAMCNVAPRGYRPLTCVDRECSQCGVDVLDRYLQSLKNATNKDAIKIMLCLKLKVY